MTPDDAARLEARYGPEVLVALDGLQDENPRAQLRAAADLCRWLDERAVEVGVRRTYRNREAGLTLGAYERIRIAHRIRKGRETALDAQLVIVEAVRRLRAGQPWRRVGALSTHERARGLLGLHKLAGRCYDGIAAKNLELIAWLNVEALETGRCLLRGRPVRLDGTQWHRWRRRHRDGRPPYAEEPIDITVLERRLP